MHLELHPRPDALPCHIRIAPCRLRHQLGMIGGRHESASTRLVQGPAPSSPGSHRGIGPSGSCWAGTRSQAGHGARPRAGHRRTRRPAAHMGCELGLSGRAAGRAPWCGQAREQHKTCGCEALTSPSQGKPCRDLPSCTAQDINGLDVGTDASASRPCKPSPTPGAQHR